MASEKSPLLERESEPSSPDFSPSHEGFDNTQPVTYVSVPPIGPDELPPPYCPSPHGGMPTISCKVCGFMIDVSGRKDQHVVKCNRCNEATPIKTAPPGKKYVRCPCNCLLICKSTSQRIACPRTNCKKIINLTQIPANPIPPNVPGVCQVACAHCHNDFLFNTLTNALARCPHCRKVSSVGHQFARSRGVIYLIAAFVILAIAIGVTVGTYVIAKKYGGLYVVTTGFFILGFMALIRSVCYFTMKVSTIEAPGHY